MKFSELVRLLEHKGFTLIKGKGSIRYDGKPGIERLVRIDYHGSKEVPTGTCHALLSRLRKNSIYTQNAVGIFHMAPMSKQVQDAQKGRPARPQ